MKKLSAVDLKQQIENLSAQIDLKKIEIRQDYTAFKKKLFSPATIILGGSILAGYWFLSRKRSRSEPSSEPVALPTNESFSRRLLNSLEIVSFLASLLNLKKMFAESSKEISTDPHN